MSEVHQTVTNPVRPHHEHVKPLDLVRRAFFIALGAFIVAVGLEVFLVPNKIIDGGITGVSIMLEHLTGIELGYYLFFLNLPFFIFGYRTIGRTFAFSTRFGIIVLSASTFLLHHSEPLTHEPLLAAIFGGILLGIGVGMVIRFGGSLDGTEIVAVVFNRRTPFSVGEIVMFLNIFILGSAGFVFNWDNAMLSLIAYFIAFKVIDLVIEGLDESKSVWIISDRSQEIGDAIISRLGRGVTYLQGAGGYTGDDKRIIFCVITRLEEAKMKSIVGELDPSAFMAIANIHDVRGGRFKKKNIH